MKANEDLAAFPAEVRRDERRDDDHSSRRGDGRFDAVTCACWEAESSTAQSETSAIVPLVVVPLSSHPSVTVLKEEEEEQEHCKTRKVSVEDLLLEQLRELNRAASSHENEACLQLGLEEDRDDSSLGTLSTIDTVPSCHIEWSGYDSEDDEDDDNVSAQEEEERTPDFDPTFDLMKITQSSSADETLEQASLTPSSQASLSAREASEGGDDSYFTEGFICVGELPRVY